MRESIKKRIEAVRRGEVPEGYIETMAGCIPADWSSAPLSEISDVLSEQAGDREFETLSISAGIGFVNQAEKFGKELSGKQYTKYTVLRRGDFAYNKGNSKRYPQGCTYMLRERDEAAVPNVFECFRIIRGYPEYYEQLFINGFMNKQLTRKINHGVRDDGLLNLTDEDFYSIVLPVPPPAEQQKIAEILATCDRIIELKQQLLEEKCRQKQWLMQKLLDPNSGVRLPGFNGIWKKCKLGKLGSTYSGLSGKSEGDFGEGAPYIPYVNIFSNPIVDIESFEYVRVGSDEKQSRVQYGDIFFTTSSETPTEIGMSSVYLGEEQELYLNSFCFGFRLNNFESLVPEYAAYCFRGLELRKTLYKLAQGATRYNLSKTDFIKETIVFPPTIREQQAIANILKTADLEIETFQKDLDAWRQKKKALMQLLLTGLVRTKC